MENVNWDEVFADIEKKNHTKKDFIISRDKFRLSESNGKIVGKAKEINTGKDHPLGYPIHEEITGELFRRLKMPTRYFKKLMRREQFELIADHVDYNKENSGNPDGDFLFRTLKNEDGRFIRGVLTDRYNIFDDEELAAVVKEILEGKNLKHEIVYYKKGLRYTTLRITFPDILKDVSKKDLQKGDILKAGLLIANSEIGFNAINIYPLVYRCVCDNGLIVWQKKAKDRKDYYKRHLGLDKKEIRKFAEVAVNKAIEEATKGMDILQKSQEVKVEKAENNIMNLLENNRIITKNTIKDIIDEYNTNWANNNSLFAVVNSMTRVARNLETEKRIELEKNASKFLNKKIAA